jgi:hypothetical protein
MGFSVSLRAILGHRRMATSKEMTAGPALPLILKFTLPARKKQKLKRAR